jgi:hypothetical protein
MEASAAMRDHVSASPPRWMHDSTVLTYDPTKGNRLTQRDELGLSN